MKTIFGFVIVFIILFKFINADAEIEPKNCAQALTHVTLQQPVEGHKVTN